METSQNPSIPATNHTARPQPPRVCLVNMPFAPLEMPSLALAQIKTLLTKQFAARVRVEIYYFNLEFLEITGGTEPYQAMTSGHARLSGAADWFFRSSAFPEAPDNISGYLERFFFDGEDETIRGIRRFLTERRPLINKYLDRLIEKYRLDEAAIIGCTCLFHQTMASLALARRVKQLASSAVTVIGGAACECEMGMELARRCDQVDYVFSGSALVSFPRFVERCLAGDLEGCSDIKGVFPGSGLKTPCHKGRRAQAQKSGSPRAGEELDINLNLIPDYDDFLNCFEKWVPSEQMEPILPFETSRGCSWGEKSACAFCGLNGMRMSHRSMSPRNALNQFAALFRYFPRCRFFLAADTLVPPPFFNEVFPFLNTPEGAMMMFEVRPVLSEHQLQTLRRAGVMVIQPGIESLSTRTLKLMRKGTSAAGNLRFLKTCARFGLRVEWNLLVGTPGEPEQTLADYLDIIPRLTHLPPPAGAFPVSFDRFSRYFGHPEEYGLDLRPHEFYEYVFPFPKEAMRNIAYHFVDNRADHDRLNMWIDRLNEAISRWRTRWTGADGHGRAVLKLEKSDNETILLDRRDGDERRIPLSPDTVELLKMLETPRSMTNIRQRIGEKQAETQLGALRELGVLFEENGRTLGLIML